MNLSLPAPPALLARLGRKLPAPLVSLHFTAGLELARRFKWLAPPAELDGRRFAITVEDLGLRSCFVARGGAFRPVGRRAAELELGARLADFLALMRADMDADTFVLPAPAADIRRHRAGPDREELAGRLAAPAWLDKLGALGRPQA